MENIRLLIVDDFTDLHEVMSEFLTKVFERSHQSCEISSAFQGSDAFEMVVKSVQENKPYDLIFLDMRMPPGWDGLKTAEKILEVSPNMKIIFTSAYSDYSREEIIQKIGKSETLYFADKPFNLKEVEELALRLTQHETR